MARIIQLVRDAGATKAPIAKMADSISAVFVPIVMIIALVAALVWLLAGASFETALSIGIAVLVISCPCALGLATPAAIMVGTGKGAEYGILSTSGEALQTLSTIDTVVLDKTGTITAGKPVVESPTEESSIPCSPWRHRWNAPQNIRYELSGRAENRPLRFKRQPCFKPYLIRHLRAPDVPSVVGNQALMERNGFDLLHSFRCRFLCHAGQDGVLSPSGRLSGLIL